MTTTLTPTSLTLVRHGQTDWNLNGRFQGRTDIPLNETGRRQAALAARALVGMHPDVIYCSPLIRTQQTAEPLLRATGMDFTVEPDLAEISVGSWEGMTFDQVDQIDPQFRRDLSAGRDARRSDEGETASETGVRVAGALRAIVARHPGKQILVFSHGVAIRQGIAALLGWGWDQSQQLGVIDNCSWQRLEDRRREGQSEPRWQLGCYNVNVQTMMSWIEDPSAEQGAPSQTPA